ncbi:hypothetical protein H5410_059523 [Solanum commersonii]|uniref:Uncharacterized protein n=1 Tax=Solanum commersonii TaxID=4109 RepID=A0A9J5W2N7_SOLCO|nr:hypothetical protein H5410_059523 [Solanum commersonii]
MMIRASSSSRARRISEECRVQWRRSPSVVLWVKQGDNNTKFFQRVAMTHRRCNTIDRHIGTHVSWQKSACSVNQVNNMQGLLADNPGCQVAFPTKYTGMPLKPRTKIGSMGEVREK